MNIKKIIKRSLIGVGVFLLLIVVTAVAVPYFFKDKIVAAVKKEINKNVHAKVDFKDVSLGLLWTFPDFTLGLEDFSVEGIDEFAGLKLAEVKNFALRLDLMSVINSSTRPMEIKQVVMTEPKIYVKVLKNGKANYDIAKPSNTTDKPSTSSKESKFDIKLRRYAIENGKLTYDDDASDMFLELKKLNHSGKGNFDNTIYDLVTTTTADAFTIETGGIPYLNAAKTAIDFKVNIDNKTQKYTFKENSVQLNALILKFNGFVQMPNAKDILLDMKFDAPKTNFKQILSMIPAAYTKDFASVKASGNAALNGYVKGVYNEKNLPAFETNLSVDNASFQYPSLPMGVSEINLKTNVKSPSADFDQLAVDVSKLHFKLGANPFDAVFSLRTPMSDPQVKADVKGIINLNDLSKAFPMEGVKTLNGIINANLATDTRMSYIDKQEYEKVKMSGKLQVSQMNYVAADMPVVKINDLKMDFSPSYMNLENFDALLGKSDIQANGKLDNILAYFSKEKTMKGNLTLRSTLFNANEWTSNEPVDEQKKAADKVAAKANDKAVTTTTEEKPFDRFDFTMDVDMKRIVYDIYDIRNTSSKGHFTPNKMVLSDFKTQIGKSDIQLNGELNDVFAYLYDNGKVTGSVQMKSNVLDVNELTAEPANTTAKPTTTATTAKPTTTNTSKELPFDRFDLSIDADIKSVLYDTYNLRNVIAKGRFTTGKSIFNNFGAQIGKSDIQMSGELNDLLAYLFTDGKLSGKINLNSTLLDMNELTTADQRTANKEAMKTEAKEKAKEKVETGKTEAPEVPKNIDLEINGKFGRLLYDKYDFKEMVSAITIRDQRIELNNARMVGFGGNLGFNGYYDTKNPAKPAFKAKYNLQKLQFKEVFDKINTVQAFAPALKFVEGIFSSDLTVDGSMKKDFSVDYNSLNVDGALETIDAFVRNLVPLKQVGDKLNIAELKNDLRVMNTRNFIHVKDGKFIVDPFDFKFKDIDMNIRGAHGITQEMEYLMKVKVPRALLAKNPVGAAANSGLDFLSSEASKLGVNMGSGENVNFAVQFTGSMMSPKIKIQPASSDGKSSLADAAESKLKEEADKLKEKAEAKAKEEAEKLKAKAQEEADKLKAKAQEEADKLKEKAKAEADKLKKEAEDKLKAETDKLKREADEKLKAEAEKLKNQVGDKTKAAADSIKNKLGDKAKEGLDKLNPFKKKN